MGIHSLLSSPRNNSSCLEYFLHSSINNLVGFYTVLVHFDFFVKGTASKISPLDIRRLHILVN